MGHICVCLDALIPHHFDQQVQLFTTMLMFLQALVLEYNRANFHEQPQYHYYYALKNEAVILFQADLVGKFLCLNL